MAVIDYYKTLGLTKNASADEIKKAYRKLARKFHPDLNPNDKEAQRKFQQINEANEVLSNPENRKKYDEYGEHWQQGEQYENARRSQQRDPGGYSDYTYNAGGGDFSDFFGSMFGGGGRQTKFKGPDYNAELHLTLRDIVATHKQTLSVNGKNIRITVNAGVANGQIIKLKGFGGPGANGGPAGDLYITFIIAEDPEFKRLGNDLYKTVEIDLYTAVLGGEVTVNTLDGKVKLKVAAGTQNDSKAKLRNKGVPIYKTDTYGDLIITFKIKIPTNLNEKQLELFRQLAATS